MATIVIKDKNLVPQNIKKGVTILKVTGTLEEGGSVNNQNKTVSSSTSNQTVTYDNGYTGLGTVTINKYTLDSKTVDPSTSQVTVNSSADGLSSVTVNAVTSSIDGNIQAGNIKKDVTILGVTGTYESTPVQPVLQDVSVSYSQNGSYTLEASSGYDGLGTVDIDVSVASQGGNDWLVDALAGNITDLSGYTLPASKRQYQYKDLFYNKQLSITKSPVIGTGNETAQGQNAYYAMFKGITTLTQLDFSGVSILWSQLQCGEICSDCTNLTTINFSNLERINSRYAFSSAFYNCPNLTTAILHPNTLAQATNIDNHLLKDVTTIQNLTLTAMATNNIDLQWQSQLTAASVLNVLTHLDLNTSGKTVTFYTNGLSVQDDAQNSIQTAYNAAITAGWTISNLTIVQPEPEPEPEPESQPCPACGGTGIDPETGETCSTCDGSGVIS